MHIGKATEGNARNRCHVRQDRGVRRRPLAGLVPIVVAMSGGALVSASAHAGGPLPSGGRFIAGGFKPGTAL